MKLKKLMTTIGGVALLPLAMISNAHAIDTMVQYSTTGTGNGVTNGAAGGYDITGINEFDWQSSGDLVINNVKSGATSYTNFQTFVSSTLSSLVGGAVFSSTTGVNFDIHAQARLNDMLDTGGSVAPVTLDRNGTAGGDTGFEITAALNGSETANFVVAIVDSIANGIVDAAEIAAATQTLNFLTLSGSYEWFHDDAPDSVVDTGAGFVNGTSILKGVLSSVFGSAIVDSAGKFAGSVLMTNTVTAYNSLYIQTDPTANRPLTGTTFDTLLKVRTTELGAMDSGDKIGLDQYIVGANDLGLKADANSKFTATPSVPEPQSLLLLAIGLLGLGAFKRKARVQL